MYRDLIGLRRNLSGVTRGLCGQNIHFYHFDDGAKKHLDKLLFLILGQLGGTSGCRLGLQSSIPFLSVGLKPPEHGTYRSTQSACYGGQVLAGLGQTDNLPAPLFQLLWVPMGSHALYYIRVDKIFPLFMQNSIIFADPYKEDPRQFQVDGWVAKSFLFDDLKKKIIKILEKPPWKPAQP